VDPAQRAPLDDPAIATRMRAAIAALMHANDAPAEMFARYGLTPPPGAA